jgi:prepilin-type N-terminal cleavage/methylation domain-containing protein
MRKKSGFTLLELMTVIGIMAVLSTIAIPNFLGWLPKYKLGSAARDILSAMQYARLVAVKDNVDVRVNFDTDNNNFLIFRDLHPVVAEPYLLPIIGINLREFESTEQATPEYSGKMNNRVTCDNRIAFIGS